MKVNLSLFHRVLEVVLNVFATGKFFEVGSALWVNCILLTLRTHIHLF